MQYEPTQEQIIDILGNLPSPHDPSRPGAAGCSKKVRLGVAANGEPLYLCVVVTHPRPSPELRSAIWWYAGNGTTQCPSGAWTKRGPHTQVMTPVNEYARVLRAEGQA